MKVISEWLTAAIFTGFIAVKIAGHVFAAWSWLWIFMPIVPWIGLLVQHFGL